jgi:hypothetical protein
VDQRAVRVNPPAAPEVPPAVLGSGLGSVRVQVRGSAIS